MGFSSPNNESASLQSLEAIGRGGPGPTLASLSIRGPLVFLAHSSSIGALLPSSSSLTSSLSSTLSPSSHFCRKIDKKGSQKYRITCASVDDAVAAVDVVVVAVAVVAVAAVDVGSAFQFQFLWLLLFNLFSRCCRSDSLESIPPVGLSLSLECLCLRLSHFQLVSLSTIPRFFFFHRTFTINVPATREQHMTQKLVLLLLSPLGPFLTLFSSSPSSRQEEKKKAKATVFPGHESNIYYF